MNLILDTADLRKFMTTFRWPAYCTWGITPSDVIGPVLTDTVVIFVHGRVQGRFEVCYPTSVTEVEISVIDVSMRDIEALSVPEALAVSAPVEEPELYDWESESTEEST